MWAGVRPISIATGVQPEIDRRTADELASADDDVHAWACQMEVVVGRPVGDRDEVHARKTSREDVPDPVPEHDASVGLDGDVDDEAPPGVSARAGQAGTGR